MRHGCGRRWRTYLLAITLTAMLGLAPTPAPAGAQLLPLLGGDDGSAGSGGSSTTTATTTSKTPPAGGTTIEGESLSPGTRINTTGANGGAFLRTLGATTTIDLASGTHQVTVRAKAPQFSRLRITVDGVVVASYAVTRRWAQLTTVVRAGGPTAIRVEAEALPSRTDPRVIDLDWLHAGAHEPVFTVAGNRILDPSGATFVPRGVTAPGHQAASAAAGRLQLPPSMVVEQHAWGIAAVRIPLNQEHWLANCASAKDGVGLGYRAAIESEVDRLTQHGIMPILTLTRTERGKATGCAPAGFPVFKEMADTRSLPFWRSVATRFRDDPLVAFDLFNEPNNISDSIWQHGGTVTYIDGGGATSTQRSYEAVGMQDLYDAVRGTGADNLVLVSGQRWASDPRVARTSPLNGYGIVLAVHTYCHGCAAPSLHPSLDVLVDDDIRDRHAIVISETGWSQSWSSSYNRKIIDWAEARGIGWSIYAWGHPDADYSLLASWVPASFPAGGGTTTMRPSWAGAPVWNELAPIRVSRGFDAQPLPEN